MLALYHEGDDLDGCSTHLLAVWSLIGLFRGSELVSGPSGRAIAMGQVLAGTSVDDQLAPIADLSIPAIAAADVPVLVVQLDASKTKQRGSERHPDFRPLYKDKLCPIQALARYLRRRVLVASADWSGEAPRFVGSEGAPASTRSMLAALRSRLQSAGYTGVDVMGLHSGRIGGSTKAKGFAVGMPPDKVRRIGGWSGRVQLRAPDVASIARQFPTLDTGFFVVGNHGHIITYLCYFICGVRALLGRVTVWGSRALEHHRQGGGPHSPGEGTAPTLSRGLPSMGFRASFYGPSAV